jgi:hypothetical protein
MSAFIVDKRHIDALLTAGLKSDQYGPLRWLAPAPKNENAYRKGEPWGPEAAKETNERRRELTAETAHQVGAMLVAENQRSVNFRYDEEKMEDLYEYEPYRGKLTPVQVLKAIACFDYQACETPDWDESEAKAFCNALMHRMIVELPGYDEAKWEIQE